MKKEIEATILSIDKDKARKKLRENNFELKIPEYLMKRKTFDFSKVSPGLNKWGRIRQESDKITMTVKEERGKDINSMYEIEVTVNNFDDACSLFEACNITAKSFQENLREVWVKGEIEVTIDTWPGLKPLMEIEGIDEDLVRKITQDLGYDFNEAIFGSIDLVYEKELGIPREQIIVLPEITFVNPPQK